MISPQEFASALIATATDFVGLVETQANAAWDDPKTIASEKAKSDLLAKTMKRVGGWTPGLPYCAAFDGAMVILTLERLGYQSAAKVFGAKWTAHCMTNVRRLKKDGIISDQPSVGGLMLMRHGASDSGHAAITAGIDGAYPNRMLANIEGNTSAGSAGSQRNGDGIFLKARNVRQNGNLATMGWLSPADLLAWVGVN